MAAILAYLTFVAGIIGAAVVSFLFVFSAPSQPPIPQQSAAIASTSTIKAATVADAKKPVLKNPAADNSAVNHVATATQKREEATQTAVASPTARTETAALERLAASEGRPKTKISRAQWRQIVQQERRRRIAYQQNSDFESRFLGYAD